MGKVKIKKKETRIDMTAMSDFYIPSEGTRDRDHAPLCFRGEGSRC